MEMDIKASKNLMRREMKERLAKMSVMERQRQSKILQDRLFKNSVYAKSKNIAIYLSLPLEFDTMPIVKDILQDDDKRCFIPNIVTQKSGDHSPEKKKMVMQELYSLEDLSGFVAGELNVLSPPYHEEILRVDPLSENGPGLDLIILPGMAFDYEGGRLGKGKGYYDNYLIYLKDIYIKKMDNIPIFIAMAFDEQIVNTVPREEHDQLINIIIHPSSSYDDLVVPYL